MRYERFDPKDPNSFYRVPENPFIIDFTDCLYGEIYHHRIRDGLGFPDYYGCNWDAFWDCIQYFADTSAIIEIHGFNTLPKSKEWDREKQMLLKLLAEEPSGNITVVIKS